MSKLTYGLSSVKVGNISSDGSMGTDLSVLGQTFADTCRFVQEDGEVTDLFCEESDEPILTLKKSGRSTLSFSIMNPDTDVLEQMLGGTIVGGTWNAPSTSLNIEKSIEVTPKSGFTLRIPRALIKAKINGEFSKKNVLMVEVSASVLTPKKSGLAPYSFVSVDSESEL